MPGDRGVRQPTLSDTGLAMAWLTAGALFLVAGVQWQWEHAQGATVAPRGGGGGGTIVWVIIGDYTHGQHVRESIQQARLWNPHTKFVVLVSKGAMEDAKRFLSPYSCTFVDVSGLDSDDLLVQHSKVFFVSGNMGGGANSNDFNLLTSKRIYYVHAWIARENATHVFHLENDNMIYFDVDDWIRSVAECGLEVATTCREMRPTRRFLVAGVLFIRSAPALALILRHFNSMLAKGKGQVVAALKTTQVNDMSLLANYYWVHMKRGHPPDHYVPPTALTILPEGGRWGLGADDNPTHVDKKRRCVWDRAPMMFDNAALGIWFYGDFHQKKPKLKRHGAWGAYQRIPAEDGGELLWPTNKSSQLTFPVWNGVRVASIHMHSKQLKKAMSTQTAPHRAAFSEVATPLAMGVVDGKDRRPSHPYITGDGFRALCPHRCERPGWRLASCAFKPVDVRAGDCVYLATTDLRTFRTTSAYLRAFDRIRKNIKVPYTIVTHNGDLSTPDGDTWHPNESNPIEWREKFARWMDSPFLVRWFASNCNWEDEVRPKKLVCIPIGLENRYNSHGGNLPPWRDDLFRNPWSQRGARVLVDFQVSDQWKPDRGRALSALQSQSFVTRVSGLSYHAWRQSVYSHAFVACPHGHGADTHRVWEVLILGSVPVVRTSKLDELYAGLPVLVVQEWTDVTATLLHDFQGRRGPFDFSRLKMDYWIGRIVAETAAGVSMFNTAPLCIAPMFHGENANRIVTLANAIRRARSNHTGVALGAAWSKWYRNWFDGRDGVLLDHDGKQCGETLDPSSLYYEHSPHIEPFNVELVSLIPAKAVRAAAAAVYGSTFFVSVHRRMHPSCSKPTGNIMCRQASDYHPACEYTQSSVMAVLQTRSRVILFTDGLSPKHDSSFKHRDQRPFPLQMWAMTLSKLHFGNPLSSIDYVVSHWRNRTGVRPEGCFGGDAQPQRRHDHPTAKAGVAWSSRKLLMSSPPRLTNDEGNDWISQKMQSGRPFVVGRFGAAESCLLLQFLDPARIFGARNPIRPCADPHSSSGIYPETSELFLSFSSSYWEALTHLDEGDAMASHSNIRGAEDRLFPRMSMGVIMNNRALEPFYFSNPWSQYLGGKTVLVVHSFTDSIKCQLRRSNVLFANPLILPPGIVWKHVTMPQCLGRRTPHSSWHETLGAAKKMIDDSGRFDVAIVAAGSYAMPLAMHCKTRHRSSAIVMGGGSQLLFGLKGRRWNTHPVLSRLYNSHWMYPLKSDTPHNANTIEDRGPYWGAANQQENRCPVRELPAAGADVHCLVKCPAEPIIDPRVVCLSHAEKCLTVTHGRGVPDSQVLDEISGRASLRACTVWHYPGTPRAQMRTCRRVTSPTGIAVVVLTKNRPASLARLLRSITSAHYRGGAIVAVDIRIDGHDAETLRIAKAWAWGHKTVTQTNAGGLRSAWLGAWPNPVGRVVVLEDDIELSPEWHSWLVGAWDAYGGRKDLAGISLQRQTLVPKKPSRQSEIVNGHKPFLYRLVGSIGFSPHPGRWKEFMDWVKTKDLRTFDARVDGLVTSDWYDHLDKKTMWTQLFIRFCDERGLSTLYVNLPDGKTLAAHWREKGEHYAGGDGRDFPPAEAVLSEFPSELAEYGWDGKAAEIACLHDSNSSEYRWKIPGLTQAYAVNLCSRTSCVPVKYTGTEFVGKFLHQPRSTVTVRWMWKNVAWEGQTTRTTVDYQWEGCNVRELFVDRCVCTWEPGPAPGPTLPPPPPQPAPAAFEREYYVGDSTMKRVYDARLRRCRALGRSVPAGKLHMNTETTCDGTPVVYRWSAGFAGEAAGVYDDTPRHLAKIDSALGTLVVVNTGHNYINMGPADFEAFAKRLGEAIGRFAQGYVLEPPAMNTSWWVPRLRCMRNNVAVQARIAAIRRHITTDRIVPAFWNTLSSRASIDGVHYAGRIYDGMLDELWALIHRVRSSWRRTLGRAKDVNGVVTMTMSTGGDGGLLTNFLNSAPFAVVFTPRLTARPGNARYHIPTALLPDVAGSFGQVGFSSATAVKATLVLNVLLMGFNVTWADQDTVFNTPPAFPEDGCDILSSQDGGVICDDGGNRDHSCTGFLHFRHNRRVVKFVEAWAARTKTNPDVFDQCQFQRLVTEGSGGAKVCALGLTEYANGFMWVPSVCPRIRNDAKTAAFRTYGVSGECMTASMLKAATVVHANYLIGNSNKVAALKAAGFWNATVRQL